jgi:NhaP-type Na+/H+ or K+/H+ antiporter
MAQVHQVSIINHLHLILLQSAALFVGVPGMFRNGASWSVRQNQCVVLVLFLVTSLFGSCLVGWVVGWVGGWLVGWLLR